VGLNAKHCLNANDGGSKTAISGMSLLTEFDITQKVANTQYDKQQASQYKDCKNNIIETLFTQRLTSN
jgi:hypothetical protein